MPGPGLQGRDTGARAEPGSHRFLLDQLIRFVGSNARVPLAMFPYRWPSKAGRLGQAVWGLYFLVATLIRSRSKFLVYGLGPNMLEGEAVVADTSLRSRALACARARRPFLIVSAYERHPVARACGILGFDISTELRAYLSLNALVIFFGHRDGRPVVAHLATTPVAEEALERHRHGLEIAREAALLAPPLRALIPDGIACTGSNGYSVLVQSRLPGTPGGSRGMPISSLHQRIEAALEPLLALRASAVQRPEGADHDLIFERFPRVLGRWPELQGFLPPLLTRLQAWQRRRGLPGMLTHGDYWLRNIVFDDSNGRISGILDWERSRRFGTPGLDSLHLALMSLAMEHGQDIVGYLAQAWNWQWEDDFIRGWVARLQVAYSLDIEDIQCLAGLLYIDELHKLDSAGREAESRRRQRLVAVGPAVEAWLVRLPAEAGAAELLPGCGGATARVMELHGTTVSPAALPG